MNVEQALHHAKESEDQGLRGLYPSAAQVLACEVRHLRETIARSNIHADSSRMIAKIRSLIKSDTDLASIGFFVKRILNGDA